MKLPHNLELLAIYGALHELGHIKMLRLLRLPHTFKLIDGEAIKMGSCVRFFFIEYRSRNIVDRFLVAIGGILFPILYLPWVGVPEDYLKFALRHVIYSLRVEMSP